MSTVVVGSTDKACLVYVQDSAEDGHELISWCGHRELEELSIFLNFSQSTITLSNVPVSVATMDEDSHAIKSRVNPGDLSDTSSQLQRMGGKDGTCQGEKKTHPTYILYSDSLLLVSSNKPESAWRNNWIG